MKKPAFKKLLSSIDEARLIKAQQRVIKAAKRWRNNTVQDYYEEMSLIMAVDALTKLEKKNHG